jgi:two-component system, sensor histidine kinase and response regulator
MFSFLRTIAKPTGIDLHDKVNRLTANTTFLIIALSGFFSFFDYEIGLKKTALTNIALCIFATISLYLLYKGRTLVAKIILLLVCLINISLMSMLFKQETIVLVYYIPLLLSMKILFQGEEKPIGTVLIALGIVSLTILLLLNYQLPFAYSISGVDFKVQVGTNIGGAIFFCIMLINFITKINDDITLQIQNQSKELLKKNNLLNATLETRDRLINLISHDLRSPFLSIDASIEILSDPSTNADEQAAVLRSLRKKSENTIALLNNLLLWSQHQTDTIRFDPEPIYLEELEANVVNVLSGLVEEKRLKTIVNFEPGLAVFADKNMLEAILRNLISNAIKFSTNGGTIELKAHFENNYVVFSVIDFGIGLNETDLRKLLSKKAHSSVGTNKEQGHGIGLLLVHEFIEKHGSELIIQSEPRKGSAFSFHIKAISG